MRSNLSPDKRSIKLPTPNKTTLPDKVSSGDYPKERRGTWEIKLCYKGTYKYFELTAKTEQPSNPCATMHRYTMPQSKPSGPDKSCKSKMCSVWEKLFWYISLNNTASRIWNRIAKALMSSAQQVHGHTGCECWRKISNSELALWPPLQPCIPYLNAYLSPDFAVSNPASC